MRICGKSYEKEAGQVWMRWTKWLAKISGESRRIHSQLLSFLSLLEPSSTRNRVFRTFVMTCYVQNSNHNGNLVDNRVPEIGRGLCTDVWLLLMNISRGTYLNC